MSVPLRLVPRKAPEPMTPRLPVAGNSSFVMPASPLNAKSPMLVTLAGMVSVPLRPVPSKALGPMARLPESGSSSFVMPDRPKNALSPMLVTLVGMVSVPLRLVP